MTRTPGYDIDGQPTKVDPRDFPDPLQVEPFEPEPRRFGCSVFVLTLALLLTGAQPAPTTYSGVASWYAASGYVASVPWWKPGQDPRWASVCTFREHRAACVTVLVVGFCLCTGVGPDRIVDLSDGAFRQLAPLSAGLIRVTMEVGTAGPGLPATDQ